MPANRLNWSAVLGAIAVCLVLDGAILGASLLLARDLETAVLVLFVGGGPISLFAIGPLYSWFKARNRRVGQPTNRSAHQ